MLKDRYDNPISTDSPAARDAYVEGVDLFLGAEPGVEQQFTKAVEADPGFCLGHLALARNHQVTGRAAEAAAALKVARDTSSGLTEREAGQLDILGKLIDGRGKEAHDAIRVHAVEHPRDVLSVQPCMGVFGLIGFSGRPGREAENLAFTTSLAPHYGDDWWFLASHAFAQMEAGQLGPAERSIEAALAQRPRNANAAHYRSHLYYENGETVAGLAYIEDWRKGYDKSGMLHCHISWHAALWTLEQGDVEAMWRVVDEHVTPGGAWGPALNILTDTAAILYRAELAGVDVAPERWRRISEFATKAFPNPGIAFADVHAALAHAMAGNAAALQRLLRDAAGPAGDVVRTLAEAFGAIGRQAWAEAVPCLTDAMKDHARIGGSRAQRDLIEFAMTACLLKLGRAEEARRSLVTRRPVFEGGAPIAGLG